MALTKEQLQGNEALTGMTEAQLDAVVQMSLNDETSTFDKRIGERIGEVYRQMDEMIATVTGVSRNGAEKTYLYLERAAKVLNEKATANDSKIEELQSENARLQGLIASGSTDAETKKALTQAQKELRSVQAQYTELKAESDKAREAHAAELLGVRVDYAIASATAGIKLKQDLPASVADVVMQNVVSKLKAANPEFVDDGKGGKVLAFMNADGTIRRNADLKPMTVSELMTDELRAMGVLDEGRKVQGAGTRAPQANGGGAATGSIDVSGAKTQTEAYEAIAQNLMSQGLVNGSAAFQKAMDEAWIANNVSALPRK